jgi:hypothetical protein
MCSPRGGSQVPGGQVIRTLFLKKITVEAQIFVGLKFCSFDTPKHSSGFEFVGVSNCALIF